MQPKISICIPTYNSSKTLRRTLDSVFEQNYPNKEVILVDNNSEDSTIDIAHDYISQGLVIYRNETNIGVNLNHNKCMRLASGDYIHLLSSDDYYVDSEVLNKIAEAIEHLPSPGSIGIGRVSGVFGSGKTYSPSESVQAVLVGIIQFKQIPSLMVFARCLINSDEFISTNQNGYADDTSFYFRIMQSGPYIDLIDKLIVYSINEDSITQRLNSQGVAFDLHKRALDKWVSDYRLSSWQRTMVFGRECARVLRAKPMSLEKIVFLLTEFSYFQLVLGIGGAMYSRARKLIY